jgi:hypothetical protein
MGVVDCFRAGGWPMYPILVLGVALFVASARYAKQPSAGRLRFTKDLRYSTLIIGILGTTLGLIHTLMGLSALPPDANYVNYALLGTGESLNCIGFALHWLGWSALITMVGGVREVSEA